MQAPVKALDPDGSAIVAAGTAVFAVAAVISYFAATGPNAWRFWVALLGTAMGLVAMAAIAVKRSRRPVVTPPETGPATLSDALGGDAPSADPATGAD
ncbi:MAG: DUF2530 domain-containing protein [Propionibacteriaceae bacterium]|jgi:hypothetical protein|nr:DUF2530 domain-containing protein [Propionibacteriaceae bacterium]